MLKAFDFCLPTRSTIVPVVPEWLTWLRVGKQNFRLATLVGAAMCSELAQRFQLFDIPLLLAYALSFGAVVLVIETVLIQPFEVKLSRWRPRAA